MDSLFRINHTDPWVGGDAHRTSRVINFQNTRTSGNAIHGRAQDEVDRTAAGGAATAAAATGGDDSSGDGNVIVAQLTGGVEYARPLSTGGKPYFLMGTVMRSHGAVFSSHSSSAGVVLVIVGCRLTCLPMSCTVRVQGKHRSPVLAAQTLPWPLL